MPEVDSIYFTSTMIASQVSKLGKPIRLKGSKKNLVNHQDLSAYTLEKVKSRGKEIVFIFNVEDRKFYLFFTFGLTGSFSFANSGVKVNYETCRISFENLDLVFSDQRRFGKWRFSSEMNWRETSPCVLTEKDLLRTHILNKLENSKKFLKKPLYEILMNQSLFNGIGNYLRAEILGKLKIDPYQTLNELYKENPLEFDRLLSFCFDISKQGFLLRASLRSEKAKTLLKDLYGIENISLEEWKEYYRNEKNSIGFGDSGGRTFWCVKKFYKENG